MNTIGRTLMSLALLACSAQDDSKTLGPVASVGRLASPEFRERGRVVFAQNCAHCHGVRADGQGIRREGLSGKPAGNWPVAAEKTQAARTADAAISEAVPDHEPDGEIAGAMAQEETGSEELSDQPAADISDSQPDEPASAEDTEVRPDRFSVPGEVWQSPRRCCRPTPSSTPIT